MQHVTQRLGMHQPMLDRHVRQQLRRKSALRRVRQINLLEPIIDCLPQPPIVLTHLGDRRPVARLIGRQSAADRINSKRKQTIELWIEGLNPQQPLAQQVPVEGFQMTYIKNDAMPLANRALIERTSANDFKELIGFIPGFSEALKDSICNSLHASRLLTTNHNCRTRKRPGPAEVSSNPAFGLME